MAVLCMCIKNSYCSNSFCNWETQSKKEAQGPFFQKEVQIHQNIGTSVEKYGRNKRKSQQSGIFQIHISLKMSKIPDVGTSLCSKPRYSPGENWSISPYCTYRKYRITEW